MKSLRRLPVIGRYFRARDERKLEAELATMSEDEETVLIALGRGWRGNPQGLSEALGLEMPRVNTALHGLLEKGMVNKA